MIEWMDKYYLTKTKDRIWGQVDIKGPDECWNWKGTTNGVGYGQIRCFGKWQYVHRIVFEMEKETILSSGQYCCHSCDNPSCVNPNHLFVGSPSDNQCDRIKKGRYGNCGKPTKFHVGEIWLMRKLYYKIPKRFIAKMFKTSPSNVHYLVNNELVQDRNY